MEYLCKTGLPDQEGVEEIWAYLADKPRKSGYTAEELLRIWSGDEVFRESELASFRELLQQESFFRPDSRRLFLFHPLPEEEVRARREPQVMEVNEMLALVDQYFPSGSGLYKKGARFAEKIALLTFNFPAVEVPRAAEALQAFEAATGWKVQTNTQCNISALKLLLARLLQSERKLLKKVSYFEMQQAVRAELSAAPCQPEELASRFREATGLELILDYPGSEIREPFDSGEELIAGGAAGAQDRMEQNAALALVSQAFEGFPHRLYKKGIKSDGGGKYIELAFISRQVGERYRSTLEALERETGWRIALSPNPNQNELIHKALDLLEEEALSAARNPSVRQAEGRVCIRLAEEAEDAALEGELWKRLQERYREETGFDLERE